MNTKISDNHIEYILYAQFISGIVAIHLRPALKLHWRTHHHISNYMLKILKSHFMDKSKVLFISWKFSWKKWKYRTKDVFSLLYVDYCIIVESWHFLHFKFYGWMNTLDSIQKNIYSSNFEWDQCNTINKISICDVIKILILKEN